MLIIVKPLNNTFSYSIFATENNVNDYIMLMPEGITEKAIISKSDECVQKCISHGWTFSSRMHILIWGNVKEK